MESRNKIRVILVDDEDLVRTGIKAILRAVDGIEVVGRRTKW